jgi:hypothetical protein
MAFQRLFGLDALGTEQNKSNCSVGFRKLWVENNKVIGAEAKFHARRFDNFFVKSFEGLGQL